ncbi:hypothetical protein [Acinetobacter larvae]|uniref:Uncharacterized protein n=1 Tax=Acinetobacter larvae TaxID=1789224 RepID=A0A1B2LZF8_9GAMM|nr:hypothetical protein [Acinetobacter larvae]AOA58326.1 hypothetical protein BFG52_08130 [Acinetobacter larvae]
MVKKTGNLAAALAKYAKPSVSMRVGVLEEATYPDGLPVAQVAFWNEYGTKRAPPRPFFRTLVHAQKDNWIKSIGNLVQQTGDPRRSMLLVGEQIKGQLVESVLSWSDPPNAPYTIAKKGFDAPLRDSGQLSRSFSVEVNDD